MTEELNNLIEQAIEMASDEDLPITITISVTPYRHLTCSNIDPGQLGEYFAMLADTAPSITSTSH